MDIEDHLNNPKFTINIPTLLLLMRQTQLSNSYRLDKLLELQVEVLHRLKGVTGQELDDSVKAKLEEYKTKFSSYLKEDLIDDLNDLSPDS